LVHFFCKNSLYDLNWIFVLLSKCAQKIAHTLPHGKFLKCLHILSIHLEQQMGEGH
jgi:hypothetical protein